MNELKALLLGEALSWPLSTGLEGFTSLAKMTVRLYGQGFERELLKLDGSNIRFSRPEFDSFEAMPSGLALYGPHSTAGLIFDWRGFQVIRVASKNIPVAAQDADEVVGLAAQSFIDRHTTEHQ